jgi:hypothetical protein
MTRGSQLRLLSGRWRGRIVNCIGTRPKVLITAFRLYEIAIDLAVATPLYPDLAVGPANHSSYWLSLYSLLGAWSLLQETLFDLCKGSWCRRFYLNFRHTLGLKCQARGPQRRSGIRIAEAIVVPPWDSPAGGVLGTMMSSQLVFGVWGLAL